MADERNALEADIEKMVDEDMEAERRAAEEDEYGDEEESKEAAHDDRR